MASIAEALGMTLPGCAAIPAPDSRRLTIAELSGQRAVEMVWEDLTPDRILTRKSFENALTVHMAVAGSTNAIIHLIAMAGRAGVSLTPDDFDAFSRKVPVIANLAEVVLREGAHLLQRLMHADTEQFITALRTDQRRAAGYAHRAEQRLKQHHMIFAVAVTVMQNVRSQIGRQTAIAQRD